MAKLDTKLAICVPSYGDWKADFGFSLAQMCVYMSSALFFESETREVIFIDKRSSNIARAREECLEDALAQDCTHVLFIDTDQTFPMDTAHRLLRAKKEIVGCNIPLKTMPSFPTARARSSNAFGSPIFSTAPNGVSGAQGLERVWRLGCGILLIDLSILKRVPKPWFEIVWVPEIAQHQTEDWYFLKKVQEHGVEVWIDHELSRQIGHVGTFCYTHAHIPVMEEEAAA